MQTSGLQAFSPGFGTFTFRRSFVFMNIPGVTFIFEKTCQETGGRIQNCGSHVRHSMQTSGLQAFSLALAHVLFPVPLFSSTSPDAPSFLMFLSTLGRTARPIAFR